MGRVVDVVEPRRICRAWIPRCHFGSGVAEDGVGHPGGLGGGGVAACFDSENLPYRYVGRFFLMILCVINRLFRFAE